MTKTQRTAQLIDNLCKMLNDSDNLVKDLKNQVEQLQKEIEALKNTSAEQTPAVAITKTKNVNVCGGRKLTEWVIEVNGEFAAKLGKWGQAKEYFVARAPKFAVYSKFGACAEVATSAEQFVERLSQELANI